jgi:hypothetical protein
MLYNSSLPGKVRQSHNFSKEQSFSFSILFFRKINHPKVIDTMMTTSGRYYTNRNNKKPRPPPGRPTRAQELAARQLAARTGSLVCISGPNWENMTPYTTLILSRDGGIAGLEPRKPGTIPEYVMVKPQQELHFNDDYDDEYDDSDYDADDDSQCIIPKSWVRIDDRFDDPIPLPPLGLAVAEKNVNIRKEGNHDHYNKSSHTLDSRVKKESPRVTSSNISKTERQCDIKKSWRLRFMSGFKAALYPTKEDLNGKMTK